MLVYPLQMQCSQSQIDETHNELELVNGVQPRDIELCGLKIYTGRITLLTYLFNLCKEIQKFYKHNKIKGYFLDFFSFHCVIFLNFCTIVFKFKRIQYLHKSQFFFQIVRKQNFLY